MEQRRVVRVAGVCGGAPCIEGTRLTCANVVLQLSGSDVDLDGYFKLHPYLTKQDILNCTRYCAGQRCLENNQVTYCQRCSLDRRPPAPPPAAFIDSLKELNTTDQVQDPGQVFLGTPEDYEADTTPIDIWKVAEDVLHRIETERPKD